MKVLVFGDLGIDRYLICKARCLSAEAPIPVLDQTSQLDLPGMAGNVGANLAALGVEGTFEGAGGNMPIKTRVMTEDGQQLCRFDQDDWCAEINQLELASILTFNDDIDGVVVADYGKGAISDRTAETILNLTHGKPLFIDTKRNPSCWLIAEDRAILFPNQAEYTQYREAYNWFPNVVLKQGSGGLAYVQYGKAIFTRPALAKQVRSVNGAGDTVLAAFVTAYGHRATWPQALEYANMAAAIVVEQPFDQRTTNRAAIAARFGELREECPVLAVAA